MCEPMGVAEVADMLGVKRDTVDKWLFRGLLEPRWRLVAGPIFERADVEQWAEATGRRLA
jgi:predicted site-specific integrase-resolvase